MTERNDGSTQNTKLRNVVETIVTFTREVTRATRDAETIMNTIDVSKPE